MTTYALCYICGRGTKLSNARTCNYCGKYICRHHRINGLCPEHVNAISKEYADALRVQDNIIHWINRITVPILFFSFFGSFIIFSNDIRWPGGISLGIFLITLLINIFVNRSAKKKFSALQSEIVISTIKNFGIVFCDNCQTALPPRTLYCPKCGHSTQISSGVSNQRTPITFTITSQHKPATQPIITQSLPTPSPPTQSHQQPQYTPLPPPPTTTATPAVKQQSAITPLPPPPPPLVQKEHYLPPPPPEFKPQEQVKGNQDFDSLLDEIIDIDSEASKEVPNHFDVIQNPNLHVCRFCARKFTVTSFTEKCPYCQEPLYRTR